jgi:hypothetical protein
MLFINSNELSVLVLFSRSRDFIPGITFKDVLRFEERNKNVFIDTRTRDLACAHMKFHKHMRDMRDLLRFKAYFQFNITF